MYMIMCMWLRYTGIMPVFQGHAFSCWHVEILMWHGTESSLQPIVIKTVVLSTTAHKKLNAAKSHSRWFPSPASDETAASTDTLIAAFWHPNADSVWPILPLRSEVYFSNPWILVCGLLYYQNVVEIALFNFRDWDLRDLQPWLLLCTLNISSYPTSMLWEAKPHE